MKNQLSRRRKKFALLALFLLVQAFGIAQETIPLIPDPLLAVAMAEKSHKFLIFLFHRNGPESEAMGVLVANAICEIPFLPVVPSLLRRRSVTRITPCSPRT